VDGVLVDVLQGVATLFVGMSRSVEIANVVDGIWVTKEKDGRSCGA
jgi:hypothetical protein